MASTASSRWVRAALEAVSIFSLAAATAAESFGVASISLISSEFAAWASLAFAAARVTLPKPKRKWDAWSLGFAFRTATKCSLASANFCSANREFATTPCMRPCIDAYCSSVIVVGLGTVSAFCACSSALAGSGRLFADRNMRTFRLLGSAWSAYSPNSTVLGRLVNVAAAIIACV